MWCLEFRYNYVSCSSLVWAVGLATKTYDICIELVTSRNYERLHIIRVVTIINLQPCSLNLPTLWSTRFSCNWRTGASFKFVLIEPEANKLEQDKYTLLLIAVRKFRTSILPGMAGKIREGFPLRRMSFIWLILIVRCVSVLAEIRLMVDRFNRGNGYAWS